MISLTAPFTVGSEKVKKAKYPPRGSIGNHALRHLATLYGVVYVSVVGGGRDVRTEARSHALCKVRLQIMKSVATSHVLSVSIYHCFGALD